MPDKRLRGEEGGLCEPSMFWDYPEDVRKGWERDGEEKHFKCNATRTTSTAETAVVVEAAVAAAATRPYCDYCFYSRRRYS